MTGVARRETQERRHSATLKQHFFFSFAVVFSIIVNRTEEENEILDGTHAAIDARLSKLGDPSTCVLRPADSSDAPKK